MKEELWSWRRKNIFNRNFNLETQGQVRGSLKKRSIFSACASGETNGSLFKFKSSGSINKTITIRKSPTNEKIGYMDLKWIGSNNGMLILDSGEKYVWKCMDFTRGYWGWFDENEKNEFLLFKPDNLVNKSGTVEVLESNISDENKNLLLLFGLHLKLFLNNWILTSGILAIGMLGRDS